MYEQNFEQNKRFLRALPAGRISHFTSRIYPSLPSTIGTGLESIKPKTGSSVENGARSKNNGYGNGNVFRPRAIFNGTACLQAKSQLKQRLPNKPIGSLSSCFKGLDFIDKSNFTYSLARSHPLTYTF